MAEFIDEKYELEPDGWRKRRLQAIKLVAHGEMTSAQIVDICDIVRGHLFTWIRIVQEGGLDALLSRARGGWPEGTCQGVAPEIIEELKTKLAANEFVTVEQARRWLQSAYQIDRPYASVWNWPAKIRRSAEGAAAQSLQKRTASGRAPLTGFELQTVWSKALGVPSPLFLAI